MMNLFTVRWCVGLLAFGVISLQSLAAAPLAVLKTKTETFANVTVISRTPTHLFIQHSCGVANLKIDGLDIPTLRELGVPITTEMEVAANPQLAKPSGSLLEKAGASLTKVGASLNLPPEWQNRLPADAHVFQDNKRIVYGVLGGFLAAYCFFSYCALLICRKTGAQPGVLVWLPLFQLLPLLRAARMSGWWVLAALVPVLNLVTHVIWSLKIVQARGKGILTAILLIFPVTSLFAFPYLAFSGGAKPDAEEDSKPLRLEPLPA